jgi:hypothetical protein
LQARLVTDEGLTFSDDSAQESDDSGLEQIIWGNAKLDESI